MKTGTRGIFLRCLLTIVCVLGLLLVLNPENATAGSVYPGSVSGLKQTEAAKNSLTVVWNPAENATTYTVEYAVYGESEKKLAGTTSECTFKIGNLQSATKYYVYVTPSNGEKNGIRGYIYDAVTLPDKLTGLKQDRWYFFIKSLEVSWDKQSAADGYEVQLRDDKNKLVKRTDAKYYSTSFNKMKDKVYTVKCRSYLTFNGKKYYSSWASIKCLNQARIKKAKIKNGKLNVSWGKISGATGYQIYVSTKKTSGYKKVATVKKSKASYTIKKFKGKKFNSKKTYYVYVKTVCNKGKSKNTSGALYYWNTKDSNYGYL